MKIVNCDQILRKLQEKSPLATKKCTSFFTYRLQSCGILPTAKAFMCEYVKLATCRLVSDSSEVAIAATIGRAGFVSKRTTQAIMRTLGASVLSIKIWREISLTWKRKIQHVNTT